MKTIIEWLRTLPEPYRSAALNQPKEVRFPYYPYGSTRCSSLYSAIDQAFLGTFMKRLASIENDAVALEVIECDCGYHMGIDATFLDDVGDFIADCPSCGKKIDTAAVCPEDNGDAKEAFRQRGLRAIDSVKHCEYKMTRAMQKHDFFMRNTAPIDWTEEDVLDAEATAAHVNNKD